MPRAVLYANNVLKNTNIVLKNTNNVLKNVNNVLKEANNILEYVNNISKCVKDILVVEVVIYLTHGPQSLIRSLIVVEVT